MLILQIEIKSKNLKVIRLARHIEILLLGNECVQVPNLGGFVAHKIEARYDEQEQLFLPPLRTLGFNSHLRMNDSLLVQSYMEAYDLSYPEAMDTIEDEVRELLRIMADTGSYELNSLGRLYYDNEGRMNFEPCESGILTPEFYALSSFEMPMVASESNEEPVDDASQQAVPAVGKRRSRIVYIGSEWGQKTLNISLKAIRNLSVAAAVVATVCLITFPISKNVKALGTGNIESGFYEMFMPNNDKQPSKSIIPLANRKPSADKRAVKVSPNNSEVIKPTDKNRVGALDDNTPADQDKMEACWSIVICSHVSKANANALTEKLHKEGLSDAYISTNGATKVLYGHFATKEEAHAKLNALNNNEVFKDSWILEVKR